MIDQLFQKAAEDIQAAMLPEWNEFISDLITIKAFQGMTETEIQVSCIKFALEALTLALVLLISKKIRNPSKKKVAASARSTGKKFKPKKWKTDGRYYDEDKKQWIEPDFK